MNLYKLSKLGRGLIYFSLFLPLFITPGILWEYVFARNIIFYFLSAVLVFLSALYIYKNKYSMDFYATRLFWAIMCFIVTKFLSGAIGIDARNSFFGAENRMDGNIGYLALAGWLFSALIFIDGRERWTKLFKITAAAAGLVSVFAIVQAFFPVEWGYLAGKGDVPFLSHRLAGSLGNPIFLAGYLLPHIFISACLGFMEAIKKYKYLWFVLALFFTGIIFLTRTRGAITSLILTLIFLFVIAVFYFLKNNKKIFWKHFLYGLPLAAVLAIFAKFSFSGIKDFFAITSSSATRLLLWKIGISGFLDKWLFGWGPENYSYVFSKFYNPRLLKYSFYETWADKPHNQFIEILSTTGILGFAAFAVLIVLTLRALWRLMKAESFDKLRTSFLPYLFLGGALISYLGHIFFAFDTLESRMAVFMILGFIIFSETQRFHQGKKTNLSFLKNIIIILLLISVYSFAAIGTGTLHSAYYTNCARNSILENRYSDTIICFRKLKNIKTPYANNNWEYLSDTILKSDAFGGIPLSIKKEIMPIVINGLEKAAGENENNFSYHFRLGQMYNLAGTYLAPQYLDKSVAELLKARKISPKRQVVDLTLAQVYYAKKDVAAGIKTLEDLVAANENISPEPYWYLGIFYDAAGQFDKSYAYMTTAVEKGREFISQDERILYVTVLGRKKDYARMAPVYEEMLKYNKENPQWWASLATVYLELHRYDDARKAARQAIFLAPSFGDEGENFLKKIDKAEAGK